MALPPSQFTPVAISVMQRWRYCSRTIGSWLRSGPASCRWQHTSRSDARAAASGTGDVVATLHSVSMPTSVKDCTAMDESDPICTPSSADAPATNVGAHSGYAEEQRLPHTNSHEKPMIKQ